MILHCSTKLSAGMQKPHQKFFLDMSYGLAKSNPVQLSDIARSLEELIDTIQTIKRLVSKLETFDEEALFMENYKNIIRTQFEKQENLVIIDNSEVVKPYSYKTEELGKVREGSTVKTEKSYWTTNMIGVMKNKKHPTPICSHL